MNSRVGLVCADETVTDLMNCLDVVQSRLSVLIMEGKLPASPRCAKRQTKRLSGDYLATTWLRSDVFFVRDATSRGMSLGEVAGFVGHTEEEVRQKSRQFKSS